MFAALANDAHVLSTTTCWPGCQLAAAPYDGR